MQQINKVRPSISPWKQNNRIACDRMVGISLPINTSHSFDMQMWPLLFTDKKSISSLSNNSDCSNCISIVSKQTQSKILQLPFGNSLSIQILRDQSWQWPLQPHSQVIVPVKYHGYPAFPGRRFSMNPCIRNVFQI